MIKVEMDAAYTKKDLAQLFGVQARTINIYYTQGLKKRSIRGKNYTYGKEIVEWMKNEGTEREEQENPKLIKFRRENRLYGI